MLAAQPFGADEYFPIALVNRFDMTPADVVSIYGDRWAIEVTYRDVKQLAHVEDPQTWKGDGPERAANLGFWLHAATWLWYLDVSGTAPAFTTSDGDGLDVFFAEHGFAIMRGLYSDLELQELEIELERQQHRLLAGELPARGGKRQVGSSENPRIVGSDR